MKTQLFSIMVIILANMNVMNAKNKIGTNTARLFILESGIGNSQKIIFLHGSGANSSMWRNHFEALDSTFHCIAPDLPGHGKSNHLPWTTLDDVADSIALLIKNRCNGKAHVVGLSLGGSIIFKLLEKYPSLIDRAIIDGASAKPINGAGGIIFGVTLISPFIHNNAIIKIMANSLGVTPDEYPAFRAGLKMVSPTSFRRAMTQANRQKLDTGNFTVKSPTFFVSGQTESATMHETHKQLTQKNTGCRCAVYPQKGHAWMVADVETHIALVRHWLTGSMFPEKLAAL